jgi:hypothetical protein
MIRLPGAPRQAIARPDALGPGRTRKIGIIGTAPGTLKYAPVDDPEWIFVGNSSAVNAFPADRLDAIIDTHPAHCYTEGRKNGFVDYYDYLRRSRIPVFMQDVVKDIPTSMKFPREQIKQQYPYEFGSMTAQFIGWALLQGVTHLGFWGCEYWDIEYFDQRPMTVFWIGLAAGKGVQIVLPPNSTLLKNAQMQADWEQRRLTVALCGDYAYDTHSTPEKYAALKAKYKELKQHAFSKHTLIAVNDPEMARAARDLRLSLDPRNAEAAAKFGDDSKMPIELIEQEHRDAIEFEVAQIHAIANMPEDARARLQRGPARLLVTQGLPLPDGASPQSPACGEEGRGQSAGVGGADAPAQCDGLVQPSGDAGHGEVRDHGDVFVRSDEAGGAAVA